MGNRLGIPLLVLALALCASPALAADQYIYVVNALPKPLRLSLDGRAFPPIDQWMALAYRMTAGDHVLIADAGRPLTASISLDSTKAIRDARQRSFWCFIVGEEQAGGLKLVATDQDTCVELIGRGVGSRDLN
ncbi:MAG: hypothetical protein Q8L23_15135 [Caulobacter sp.]|nr:hypothetical protein [Caulobacter sp.]